MAGARVVENSAQDRLFDVPAFCTCSKSPHWGWALLLMKTGPLIPKERLVIDAIEDSGCR